MSNREFLQLVVSIFAAGLISILLFILSFIKEGREERRKNEKKT